MSSRRGAPSTPTSALPAARLLWHLSLRDLRRGCFANSRVSLRPMTDPGRQTRDAIDAPEPASLDDSAPSQSTSPRAFTRWQRVQIFVATWAGYFAVLLI